MTKCKGINANFYWIHLITTHNLFHGLCAQLNSFGTITRVVSWTSMCFDYFQPVYNINSRIVLPNLVNLSTVALILVLMVN